MQVLHDDAGRQCWITVHESGDTRTLQLDGCEEGAMRLSSEAPVFNYLWCHKCSLLARQPLTRALVLGAGAFTAAKCLALDYPEARIDVVDAEPELETVARRFFRLDQPAFANIRFHGMTAEQFLASCSERYDFVFDDLFDGFQHVPWRSRSREHFAEMKKVLSEDGVCIKNVIFNPLSADTRAACDETLAALRGTFPQHTLLALAEPWRGQNKILVGMLRPPLLPWRELPLTLREAGMPAEIVEKMAVEGTE